MKLVLVTIGLSVLFFCASQEPVKKPVEPLRVAPFEYFTDHCMRCHGENGMNYATDFANGKTDEALLAVLKSMAAGPGQSPLEKEDLVVQLAYHRAISEKRPFMAWTSVEGQTLSGEVTPNTILSCTPELPVTMKEGKWSIELPINAKPASFALKAHIDKRSASLKFAEQSISSPNED